MAKGKITILVVDDDQVLTNLYSSAFKARGYRVLVAEHGEDAIMLAETEHPDLVLLDVMMPEMHGLSVLKLLKSSEELKNTKIIMLTALSDQKTREKALKLGAYDFIVKAESPMADVIYKVNKAVS